MNLFSQDYIGRIGTLLVLILGITIYLIFKIKISPDTVKAFFERNKKEISDDLASVKMPMSDSSYNLEEFAVKEEEDAEEDLEEEPELKTPSQFEINKETLKPTIANPSEIHLEPIVKTAPLVTPPTPQIIATNDESFVIEKAPEEATIEENLASRLVADFGLFDPTLELSNYKFPTLDLLKEYSGGGITINQAELQDRNCANQSDCWSIGDFVRDCPRSGNSNFKNQKSRRRYRLIIVSIRNSYHRSYSR
jgi:S-DNA-T family DNA segregation ATPase FtsK/SpoIIIE